MVVEVGPLVVLPLMAPPPLPMVLLPRMVHPRAGRGAAHPPGGTGAGTGLLPMVGGEGGEEEGEAQSTDARESGLWLRLCV